MIVFWSYFETCIDRLFREAAQAIPGQVMEHLLDRYSGIGARLDRLYKVIFSTTYRADLSDLGYGNVAALLKRVEECRNRFAHGEPEAIVDSLVEPLVAALKAEHEGWIAVFNLSAEGSAQRIGVTARPTGCGIRRTRRTLVGMCRKTFRGVLIR